MESHGHGSAIEHYRVVVMGTAEAGKSALVQRLLHGEFTDGYTPTVEALYPFTEGKPANCEKISIEVLDTAGSYNFPDMQRIYISSANIILLVYSPDNYESYKEVLKLRELIKDQLEDKVVGMDVRMVVVSTKSDIDHKQQKITLAEAELEFIQWDIPVVETSAKENTGFEALRSYIADYIGKRKTGGKQKHRLSRLLSKIMKSKSDDEEGT
ncbi:GTP-binding protein Di-Ras1-like [Antedon mediterranea]|uniref:GTP-binding protein Di-Ras1-like n=1 Tax=Antedon mediterranea TaxID=105859 RepID=UPI003AF8122C